MNKPAVNPALARIAAIKSRSGSGMGRSFDHIEQKDELDLSPLIPTQPVTEVIIASTPEPLPALEDDTDELRVAMRLAALQADGIGAIAPTNAARYNQMDGQMDKLIGSLEEIDPRKRIITP